MFRSKTSSDRFQEQSSAMSPCRWTNSRSSCESVRLLVGFKTIAEEGIRFRLGRLRTSRNFLSLADVHFLGSSCRNSHTMTFGTEGSTAIPSVPGRRSPCRLQPLYRLPTSPKVVMVGLSFVTKDLLKG